VAADEGSGAPERRHAPRAFIALGAHATYPTSGGADGRTLAPCGDPRNGINDYHPGNGVIWETWRHGSEGFAEVTDKPWYGFGGGWGHKSSDGSNAFWGPLGPGKLKPAVPASWK
jgi:hypothetical protein